jgi:site-specific DNA recombinase
LHALLTNPLYVGKIKHKADRYPGEHEAIIAPDLFDKVQETLHYNGRTGGIQVRNRYGALLKGLLFCKGCNRSMVHTFTGRGGKRYRYYTCSRAIKSGRKACPSGSLPAAEMERIVVDQIRDIGSDPALRNEVLRQATAQLDGELNEIKIERRSLEKELAWRHAEIQKLSIAGASSGAALIARIADLHDQIGRTEARLAELQVESESRQRERLTADHVVRAFGDFDAMLKFLSIREQVRLMGLLIARVDFDVSDSTIEVSFHPSGIKAIAERQMGEAA